MTRYKSTLTKSQGKGRQGNQINYYMYGYGVITTQQNIKLNLKSYTSFLQGLTKENGVLTEMTRTCKQNI